MKRRYSSVAGMYKPPVDREINILEWGTGMHAIRLLQFFYPDSSYEEASHNKLYGPDEFSVTLHL